MTQVQHNHGCFKSVSTVPHSWVFCQVELSGCLFTNQDKGDRIYLTGIVYFSHFEHHFNVGQATTCFALFAVSHFGGAQVLGEPPRARCQGVYSHGVTDANPKSVTSGFWPSNASSKRLLKWIEVPKKEDPSFKSKEETVDFPLLFPLKWGSYVDSKGPEPAGCADQRARARSAVPPAGGFAPAERCKVSLLKQRHGNGLPPQVA